MLREIAPIILISIGALTGIAWTISVGGRLNSSPPYLFTTGIAMAVALLLATRGAPRWGYPWMAMGIVGTQALLWALLAPEEIPDAPTLEIGIASLGGPILTAVIGGAIAVRSWGDSAFFVGLFLSGIFLALPSIPLAPAGGLQADIELSRAFLALGQAGLTAGAILLWNRGRVIQSILALAAAIILSTLTAAFLVQAAFAEVSDAPTFGDVLVGPATITLVVFLLSFAIGGARRFISGRGFLAPQIPPTHPTEDEEEDEYGRAPLFPPPDAGPAEGADAAADTEPADSTDKDDERPARRLRRRRRRRRRE